MHSLKAAFSLSSKAGCATTPPAPPTTTTVLAASPTPCVLCWFFACSDRFARRHTFACTRISAVAGDVQYQPRRFSAASFASHSTVANPSARHNSAADTLRPPSGTSRPVWSMRATNIVYLETVIKSVLNQHAILPVWLMRHHPCADHRTSNIYGKDEPKHSIILASG